MATAGDRANIGYDEARMEGKGPVGGAVDAAKAALGRGGAGATTGVDYPSGLAHRGTDFEVGAHHGGMLGHTEEEIARLQTRTVITGESEPYAPNPDIKGLVSYFNTHPLPWSLSSRHIDIVVYLDPNISCNEDG